MAAMRELPHFGDVHDVLAKFAQRLSAEPQPKL
jgi:hypothetical protein